MFEREYIPNDDMILQDKVYQDMISAPDLSEEMEEVIRGEMSIAEFVERTPSRPVGLEGFKLDRDNASIVPTTYSDYLAVSCEAANRKVAFNSLVVDKLLELAKTDEGWAKIATAPLEHCPYVTPDSVISYLPKLMGVVKFATTKGLPEVDWMYSQVAGEGDVGNVRERLTLFQPSVNELKNLISKTSNMLDNYSNINSVGETFTREQFIETLTDYQAAAGPYVEGQDETMLQMLTWIAGITHKAYRVLGKLADEKDDDVVGMLSTLAKYVEDSSQAVTFIIMVAGRLNEFINHINKSVG